MDIAHYLQSNRLIAIIRRPGFWFILVALILISLPHYADALKHPSFLTQLLSNFGLDRHSFERILYLVPIVWSGFLFGQIGSFLV